MIPVFFINFEKPFFQKQQLSISNSQQGISKVGHFRLRSYGVTRPWAGKNFVLFMFPRAVPRLLYYGLSALFGDEPSPLQFSVRISCSVL